MVRKVTITLALAILATAVTVGATTLARGDTRFGLPPDLAEEAEPLVDQLGDRTANDEQRDMMMAHLERLADELPPEVLVESLRLMTEHMPQMQANQPPPARTQEMMAFVETLANELPPEVFRQAHETLIEQMSPMGGMEMPPRRPGMQMSPMQGVEISPKGTGDFAPLVEGFYDGGNVKFIHTEASDPEVADMLTEMMGPEVVTVPSLAEVPKSALAGVYVFTNGVEGDGPFRFQSDVFDSVPGDEGYSPLVEVNLVTWEEGADPRVLRSAGAVTAAEKAGEVTIERTGIVANAPVLVWPEHR